MVGLHINCDMAESYGNLRCGNDKEILSHVDAVNIACGFHGGDPVTILETIKSAFYLKKQIGAHPSYPDLVGFGRRYMEMSDHELFASMLYQIGAVKAMCESIGAKLNHVKPHGALYNAGFLYQNIAEVIVDAVNSIDAHLEIYAQENSMLEKKAKHAGVKVIYEGFADRRYNDDGTLAPRQMKGAVITSPEVVKDHVLMLQEGKAMTITGNVISVKVDTICLHGDHPEVVESLILIRNT
jgi:5-oxoprolinase (ATP-hydrolysing) subunit A